MTRTNVAGPPVKPLVLDRMDTCVQAGTRLLGLLGADIRHADLAFSFNNQLLSHWAGKYLYVPYSVPTEELENAIQGIRALDILACNVTFPHKVAIMDHLDEIDDTTRRMGSVNLVVNREGVLWGYNTDSMGFMDALHATGLMEDLDTALIYCWWPATAGRFLRWPPPWPRRACPKYGFMTSSRRGATPSRAG